MNKKIYGVVGHKGKLGSQLVKQLGAECFVLDCDITDKDSIYREVYNKLGELKKNDPYPVIVNCAGMSSVDECEKNEDKCFKVNVMGLANLHSVFGERVLNISSDYVFSGKNWFLPKENTPPDPVNVYGFSKLGAEAVSKFVGGKTIRLSRTVSMEDNDIKHYISHLFFRNRIQVPSFLYRNYLTQYQAVSGIEYFAKNYDSMPSVVNYGNSENVSMYKLLWELVRTRGTQSLIDKRKIELSGDITPRPHKGGFNISLARKLGFPIYSLQDTLEGLWNE